MSVAYSRTESRRTPREAVDFQSRIRRGPQAPTAALIVNISPHGCMVRSDEMLSIGDRLTVDVPGLGGLPGLVIWSLGARTGIEFETGIALDDYLTMLTVMTSAAGTQAGR